MQDPASAPPHPASASSEPRVPRKIGVGGWRPEGPCSQCCFASAPQAPSEYETSPEQLFYRIAHLNRGQQYLLWVAAVTSAGRGNSSEKVTIEPAGKGEQPGAQAACRKPPARILVLPE